MDIQFTTKNKGQDGEPIIVQVDVEGKCAGHLVRTGGAWTNTTDLYDACMGCVSEATLDDAKATTRALLEG